MIKEIEVDGVRYSIQAENTINTTWAELKALRDEAKLNAGTFYRITDYVTTTTQSETKSANHPFDVIVLALNENTLCEDAKAILHEGDTYFADSDLNAWKLKYCLDNDKTRFGWADETNGKGVIYRMVDEKSNDCPYDFKNILFYNTKLESSNRHYYTFSYEIAGHLYDGTTSKQVTYCYGNVMGKYRISGVLMLNKNVFRNMYFNDGCYYNTFGDNCYSNSFERSSVLNTFGKDCHDNTFRNSLINCSLDSNRTSITLNEEFYDDGSGQLVPTKHPDLSTQPSILPYKFMGQYVYEQLIPITLQEAQTGGVSFYLPRIDTPNIMFLELKVIITFNDGTKSAIAVSSIVKHTGPDKLLYIPGGNVYDLDKSKQCYAHVVYTSMPEDGQYYYESSTLELGSITMIFNNSPGPTPVSLGNSIGPQKEYDDAPYYIPISDIISVGTDWRLVLSNYAIQQLLQGYGYTEQEARSTRLNKSISEFDDAWFRDTFGEDYQNKNMFLYFAS